MPRVRISTAIVSPLNPAHWTVKLECGHALMVRRKRRPTGVVICVRQHDPPPSSPPGSTPTEQVTARETITPGPGAPVAVFTGDNPPRPGFYEGSMPGDCPACNGEGIMCSDDECHLARDLHHQCIACRGTGSAAPVEGEPARCEPTRTSTLAAASGALLRESRRRRSTPGANEYA